jgi:hypothetical protein
MKRRKDYVDDGIAAGMASLKNPVIDPIKAAIRRKEIAFAWSIGDIRGSFIVLSMRALALLVIGVLTSQLAICQLPQPIMINGLPLGKRAITISQQTWFYEDPSTDTLQPFTSIRHQRFIPLSVAPQIRGHNDRIKATRIVWLRFQLVNSHPTDTLRLWYEQGTHAISTLYDSAGKLLGQTGLFRRQPGSWPQNLPLVVPPKTRETYYVRLIDYIRVFTTESDLIRTPLGYAEAKDQEANRTKWLLIAMAMIVGCLLLMSLYTLFQYYLNRDRAYLYYALDWFLLDCKICRQSSFVGIGTRCFASIISPELDLYLLFSEFFLCPSDP